MPSNKHKEQVLRKALAAPHVPIAPLLGDNATGEFVFTKLDFSANNNELLAIPASDCRALDAYVSAKLKKVGATVGIGGYAENRTWYQRSPLFESPEGPRTVHLGIDVWTRPGTRLYAPLAGKIHSLRDNANFGDYGPTIVLEHEIAGLRFFALFGHLSRESLQNKEPGQSINCGQELATVGNFPINGDWPPHLHYQLTFDMLGLEGDFPGVAAEIKREYFLDLCPDPNIVLQLPLL